MVGNKYNRLTVVSYLGMKSDGYRNRPYLLCLCDCGAEVELNASLVEKGKTKSCGCLQREKAREAKTKHGLSDDILYNAWSNIRQRCFNKNKNDYKHYGGRGVTVCDEWNNSFESFYNWSINNGWDKGLEIDRINNDGNYEPSNCQWITQQKNKSYGKRRNSSKNKTGSVGVYKHNGYDKYVSNVSVNGNRYYLGVFNTIEDAIMARENKIKEIEGK